MNREHPATELLSSAHFFYWHLRDALRKAGVSETHLKFAVGLYLSTLSRFGQEPMRIFIEECTAGDATTLMRSVGRLIPVIHRAGIFKSFGNAWTNFHRRPEAKVLYVPPAAEVLNPDGLAISIRGDHARLWLEADNTFETATGNFVVVSAERPPYDPDENRWLTIRLPRVESSGLSRPGSHDDARQDRRYCKAAVG